MLKILKIFKRKNKGSHEPTERIREIIGVSGARYNPDYYEILRWKYVVDKETDEIVDILRDVKRVSNNLNV